MTHLPLNLSAADIHDIYAAKAPEPAGDQPKKAALPARDGAAPGASKAARVPRAGAIPVDD